MFLFRVLSFFKKGDTIQGRTLFKGGTLFKEIRYVPKLENVLNTCPPFLNHKNTILLLYYYFYENREEDENDEATLNERRLLSRHSLYMRTVNS